MDLSVVIIILLVVTLALVLLVGRPKTNDKIDSNNKSGEGSPVGTESTFNSPSPASGNSSSSLLSQLSMINARNFPALSKIQLPAKLLAFFGRKDIILEVMGRPWEPGGTICLYGDKGVGKTALVIELAHQLAPKYPDAQFYIDLKGVGDKPLPVLVRLWLMFFDLYSPKKLSPMIPLN